MKLLIANRGEIAIRIMRTAYELNIPTVAIYSTNDENALHISKADEAYSLESGGVSAYLDIAKILEIARKSNCTHIHPGYGFLSENWFFAKMCQQVNIHFIGASPEALKLFGNKVKARNFAKKNRVPIIQGTKRATTLEEAKGFFRALGKGGMMMIKALSGGGGRGMRVVREYEAIEEAYQRCQSEAKKAYGNETVYVEQYITDARHIEVQVFGDHTGTCIHLWERECSIQRQNQKLIEIAPCPDISDVLRSRLIKDALTLAKAAKLESAATVEFLVSGFGSVNRHYFIEVNPRIQVEHTVTEEVTGLDIVQLQLEQAMGKSLSDMGITQDTIARPKGFAIQARVNMETIDGEGHTIPKTGELITFDLPYGAGIRLETLGYRGYENSTHFDSLLAKLIVHHRSNTFEVVVKKLYRALLEFKIEGIETNLPFLKNIITHPDFSDNNFNTRFIEHHLTELLTTKEHQTLFTKSSIKSSEIVRRKEIDLPIGQQAISTPMPGTVIDLILKEGDKITIGQQLAVIEAMKMENVVTATIKGRIEKVLVKKGDVLQENQAIFFVTLDTEQDLSSDIDKKLDLDYIRPDLEELQQRKAYLYDENRPQAIAKRKKKGKRTARENIADLIDNTEFIEYNSLIVAAQRQRRKLQDLIENTPADGVIAGIGGVNQNLFGAAAAKCMIMSYDYTVMAGTQGMFGHLKTDRILEVARRGKLPFILFAEGGGGRPGDVDFQGIGGLHVTTFARFAALNGIMPRVAIVSGYCFAGNAALAGCADVIIATEDTSIGMGGPAMIEGGGLGVYHPKQVGPVSVQAKNGVLDIVVKDEVEAVVVAKQYLSYFQGKTTDWECADQRILRHLIPENRRRVYDIHKVIHTIADTDSVLELRKHYAVGMVTAFVRIEGQPMGLIANNPKHLGGAIDSESADKAARFIQLCDVFNIPILSLCDTPGFMVGPDAEVTGLVRHTARLFTAGAKANVPFFTVVLRKAYGLGSMGMAAGGMHEPFFTIAWPTGEFGGMGLEGAVRLGYRKELEAIKDPQEREVMYQKMVDKLYQHGKAINTASYLEIDEVIDPKDTRKWIVNGLLANLKADHWKEKGRGFVDTW